MTDHAKADVDSGVYERRYQIKPGDCVVDIGAHVGHFTQLALDNVGKKGFVIAFEPHPENQKELNRFNCDRLNIIKAAAWSWDGNIVLHHCEANSGAHSIVHNTGGPMVVCACWDIGNFIAPRWKPDFIKIDAEGAEYHILKSLFEHGMRCPMAVEIHSEELWEKCSRLCAENGMLFSFAPGTNRVGVNYLEAK